MKKTILLLAVLGAGCTCNKTSAPPPPDQPPKSLGPNGLLIDQPKDGDTVNGQWVAVTGWVDLSRFSSVQVTGAMALGLYPTGQGHLGAPNATLVMTDGGHFFAPRVPLQEGATPIVVAAVPKDGSPLAPTVLNVTGKGVTEVPMTAVATPESGGAPLDVTWRAGVASGSPSVQWDFEGDGVFDAEGATAKHTYSSAGQYWTMARAQVDGRWTYAVGRIAVTEDSQVTDEAAIGANARLLTVVSIAYPYAGPKGEYDRTPFVMVATDRGIEIFDAKLHPLRTLAVSGPVQALSGDASGRVWVGSDHQVVQYLPDGTLDPGFMDGQGFYAPDGGFTSLRAFCPLDLTDGLPDGGSRGLTEAMAVDNGVLLRCNDEQVCHRENHPYVSGAIANLRCTHSMGSSGNGIATTTSGDFVEAGFNGITLLGTGGLTDVVLCSYRNYYYVGVGPDGKLVEWALLPIPGRKSKLPFTATTVACDPEATMAYTKQLRQPRGDRQQPVLYVAGAGKLQRRVMKVIEP